MTFTKLHKYVVVSVWMVDRDAQLCEWPGKRYLWRQRSDEKWQYHHIRILVRESSRDRRPWKHCRGTFPGSAGRAALVTSGRSQKKRKRKVDEWVHRSLLQQSHSIVRIFTWHISESQGCKVFSCEKRRLNRLRGYASWFESSSRLN